MAWSDTPDAELDQQLMRLFDETAGPDTPATKPDHRRAPRSRRLLQVTAAVAVAAAATFAVVHLGATAPGTSETTASDGSCFGSLEWQRHTYVGNHVTERASVGTPLSGSTSTECVVEPVAAAGFNEINGIDPRTAVVGRADPTTVYVLAGRCAGFQPQAFMACLRRSLVIDGRRYVETVLMTPLTAAKTVGKARLTEGDVTRQVDVHSLAGIDPARAVTIAAGSAKTIFVADGACELPSLSELRACLSNR